MGDNVLIAHVGSMTACGAIINSGSPDTFINIPRKMEKQFHALDKKEKYDEKFRVLDHEGNPIVNIPYFITTEEGEKYKGFTDNEGCCPRIYTSTKQNLTIFLGVQALELWEG